MQGTKNWHKQNQLDTTMVSSSLSPRDDTGKACSHAPSFSVAARSESCVEKVV